ncbi:MAG: peptidyl-alpha-hydroxyglycine alpha-amidating lyase family protein [Gammaproteobacteria bacterium]|nr:peptidyl-alpha-hydroxyglycine alpha-amidating lyase family protein [Gammaproteobacteria bacterium]MDH3508813.1 peptidyl-alpha-hydroxyglycine alpha-amidating lyase family protein [Gammaproteobacteria bacterium]
MWNDNNTKFILAGAAAMVVCGTAAAQVNEEVNSRPDPYVMDQDFFKMPAGRKIGSTVTLVPDPDGVSMWVYDRCGDWACVGTDIEPIMKFDAEGNFVKSFGAGLIVRPHGLHIDFEGNVWVTDDQGPDGVDPRREGMGHQVHKFSSDGELLMSLGTPGVAGDGPNEFNRPSAVYVAPNGEIFVGDGHGGNSNSRVVKFSSDGTFIKAFGHRGTGPGEFESPHSLAMDSQGRLFVGDRGNSRIQIFDQEGNYLDEYTQFGRPSGIYIDANDVLYAADSQSEDEDQVALGWKEGIRIGSAVDGTVTAFIPDIDGEGSQEGVTADANGIVYGSLTGGMALRRYTPR